VAAGKDPVAIDIGPQELADLCVPEQGDGIRAMVGYALVLGEDDGKCVIPVQDVAVNVQIRSGDAIRAPGRRVVVGTWLMPCYSGRLDPARGPVAMVRGYRADSYC
jgi:hypothetical protein